MKTYEIISCRVENCLQGAESLLQLIDCLSTGAEHLCIEVHFSDFASLQAVSEVLPSSRFELYGWSKIETGAVFERPEFHLVKSARCVFDHRSLHVAEFADNPPYDWDGLPSSRSKVSFWERYAEPVQTAEREPDQQIIEDLREVAAKIVKRPLSVKTSSAHCEGYREHSYFILPSTSHVAQLLQAVAEKFYLSNGVGSFEFVGAAEALENTMKTGLYRLSDFPSGCWGFNDGDGGTPFALERASFLNPVLNLSAVDLPKVAALIDSLGNKVIRCSVIRKYLSWKLANGFSPRTNGNYLLLSKQKVGYALFAGYEQYADEDPRPKEFSSFASKILGGRGLRIKAVPYPK